MLKRHAPTEGRNGAELNRGPSPFIYAISYRLISEGCLLMAQKKRSSKSTASSSRAKKAGKQARSPAADDPAKGIARTSARSTVSGPSSKNKDVTDAATAKVAGTEAVAAAMPFNAAKPTEYGDAARDPTVGPT